ncbi:hypothetical protein LCER1_G001641 [Lachnellula cervina]|uniref:Serine/threonine-protein phosphatase 4 regulatory subunit 2 n=1 Tax=Lachnellula cervina TaxID=1316786 RepID=A0A7D8UW41_9HELO|nr:hypothetical protein LCER1_G001641 [Lachnellula cervina]
MDLDTDNEVLQILADGKSMDYELWPGLLSRLIPRLEKIAQTEFPAPASPSSESSSQIPSSPPTQSKKDDPSSQTSTDSFDKENASPQPKLNSLSLQTQALLTSITTTLQSLFSKHPPHTIQRLAELILAPRKHYRTLPTYLHAVDRVVHVSSGAHIFPLPPVIRNPSPAVSNGSSALDPLSISWGNPATAQSNLGSDESLGGALLTPIPWLNKNGSRSGTHSPLEGEVKTESTEMIDGPNGLGGIETVSVSINGVSSATKESPASGVEAVLRAEGGVTQGELLRQEQRAGVVPATQLGPRGTDSEGMGEEDEAPHARGPEEIGMEDTGPQAASSGIERMGPGISMGIDVEAAVGRKAEVKNEDGDAKKEDELETPSTPKRDAEEEIGADEKRVKEDVTEEDDDDMVLVDADGKMEDVKKIGEEDENKGSDAVDATTV